MSKYEQCEYRLHCGVCKASGKKCIYIEDEITYPQKINTPQYDEFFIRQEYIPPACIKCPNHPSNGGNGNCNCTLGTQQVVYATADYMNGYETSKTEMNVPFTYVSETQNK